MCKVFAFHGAERKVGVTMIAQSIAEKIANDCEQLEVLLLVLNGRTNHQYFDKEVKSITEYKLQLESKLLNGKDLARDCRYKGNLHVLAGPRDEFEYRYYFPEEITYLMECIKSEFDVIIIDTGDSIDCGLAVGGLAAAENKYMIVTQDETSLERYQRLHHIYEQMGLGFECLVINKYVPQDIYSKGYIGERLEYSKERLISLETSSKGRQAEREKNSFYELHDEVWCQGIKFITDNILNACGINSLKKQRKSKVWKSFL